MEAAPAFNDRSFKMYSHHEAVDMGFFSNLTRYQDGGAVATPLYPGVALITVDPKSGRKAAEAIVQIIPADKNVVYCHLSSTNKELTINMYCQTKDSTTPVRFLLGNLSNEKTLFGIKDGRTSIIDLLVSPRSYSKIPGTDYGKEVILGDTGLRTSDPSEQMARPSTGTCYTITISKPTPQTKGFMQTFDTTTAIVLHSISRQNELQVDGPEETTDGVGQSTVDNFRTLEARTGENIPTTYSTSCASTVTTNKVDSRIYTRVTFTTEVIFGLNVFFTKTKYVCPKPEPPPEPINTSLVLCGGNEMFFCPHGAYPLGKNATVAISTMQCACVDTDDKYKRALSAITMMMM